MQKDLYTVNGFCQAQRICRTTFYREVAAGRIELIKTGGRSLVTADEALRWRTQRSYHAHPDPQPEPHAEPQHSLEPTVCRALKGFSLGRLWRVFFKPASA